MGARFHRPGAARAAWILAAVGLALCRPAAAQTAFQLDGSVGINYSVVTPDRLGGRSLGLQAGPALTLQHDSPRLVWRLGYAFTGDVSLHGTSPSTFANQLELALAGQPSNRTTLLVGATAFQGGTGRMLSQRAPEAGAPAIRAAGNPDLASAKVSEALNWEATADLRLGQALQSEVTAPRYEFRQANSLVKASLFLDYSGARDAVGAELASGYASLDGGGGRYGTLSTSLLGRWNRDFDWRWSGHLSAGVSHVMELVHDHPATFLPTGSLSLAVRGERSGGSLGVGYGPTFDLQTGSATHAASVGVQGHLDLGSRLARSLAASAGYQRSWSTGGVPSGGAAGAGQAVQCDAGLTWGLSPALLATARISLAYQYGQQGNLPESLAAMALIGMTGRSGNSGSLAPLPTIGGRVDGQDAVVFPGAATPKP